MLPPALPPVTPLGLRERTSGHVKMLLTVLLPTTSGLRETNSDRDVATVTTSTMDLTRNSTPAATRMVVMTTMSPATATLLMTMLTEATFTTENVVTTPLRPPRLMLNPLTVEPLGARRPLLLLPLLISSDATTTAMPGPMVPTRILPRSSMPAKPETVTGLMLVTALLMPTVTSLLVTATLPARALLPVLPMVPNLDLLLEITDTESLESRDTHPN